MQRTNSLEKTLMLGNFEDKRRRERQKMRWLDSITGSMDMGLGGIRNWWWTGRPGVLRFMGSQRVGHDWATELNWKSFLNTLWWVAFGVSRKSQTIVHDWGPVSYTLGSQKRLTQPISALDREVCLISLISYRIRHTGFILNLQPSLTYMSRMSVGSPLCQIWTPSAHFSTLPPSYLLFATCVLTPSKPCCTPPRPVNTLLSSPPTYS